MSELKDSPSPFLFKLTILAFHVCEFYTLSRNNANLLTSSFTLLVVMQWLGNLIATAQFHRFLAQNYDIFIFRGHWHTYVMGV